MVKCEAYQQGKAFDNEYKGTIPMVLCEMNVCPYDNKGSIVTCRDGKQRVI